MAILKFEIESDMTKAIELRNEMQRLEKQLNSFDASTPESEINKVEGRLATCKTQFTSLITAAAQAGAALETDFKMKVRDAALGMNELTGSINEQKRIIGTLELDIKSLSEKYKELVNTGKYAQGTKDLINSKKSELDEQKRALVELTYQYDNEKLALKKLTDEYSAFKKVAKESADTNDDVANSAKKNVDVLGALGSKIKEYGAMYFGGKGIKEFISQVISVRGEFVEIETKLRTMLGSEEKMQDLMAQLKDYALISPLTTKDMSSALTMMIGFGIDAQESVQYLKALGDISMGDTRSFNSLALAFSQMSAAGKLMGQDLNQMINAGFNPLQTMSEKTGKSIGELKKEMSDGAITAEMVQQAFLDATSEGGKFYGMAEAGSKTINGQISMLEESMDNIFNDIGTKSEGIIVGAISTATSLVESYETIGKVLGGVVTVYGFYKAAVMLVNAADSIRKAIINAQTAATTTAAAATNASVAADARKVASSKTAAAATLIHKNAQEALNKAMLTNPYVLAGVAIGALVYGIYRYATAANAAEEAQKSFNNEMERIGKIAEDKKQKINSLIQTIQSVESSDLSKQLAFNELENIAPAITDVYKSVEELSKADISEINKQMDEISNEDREQGLRDRIKTLQEFIKTTKEADANYINHADYGYFEQNVKSEAKGIGIEGNWTFGVEDYIDQAQEELNKWQVQLDKINKAREDAAAKPTEIDVRLARGSYEESKNKLGELNDFIALMKSEIEGKPIQVPLNSDPTIDTTDDMVKSIEDKVDVLKKEQQESPITFTAEKEQALNEYTSLLSDIKSWKDIAAKSGYFFIPITIQTRLKNYQNDADKKKTTFNYVTGKYEKSKSSAKSYADEYDAAEKAYNDARKELKKIEKSRNSKNKSERDKYDKTTYETAKNNLKAAKTKFEGLGGITTTDKKEASAAEKAANDVKKKREAQEKANKIIFEENKRWSEQQEKSATDRWNAIQQAEIDAMQDGSEKAITQLTLDYKKELDSIEKNEDALLKAKREHAKKLFEADPDNKNKIFENTDEYKNITLTDDERSGVEAQRKSAEIKYNKQVEEVRKQELESMRNYMKEYGTVQQQRVALIGEWNEKIGKAQSEGERLLFTQQKNKAVQDFDNEQMKKGVDWEMLFGDVGDMSVRQLQSAKGQLKDKLSDGSLHIDDYQAIVEQIDRINEAIVEARSGESTFFGLVTEHAKERMKLELDVKDAIEQQKRATEGLANAQASLDRSRFFLNGKLNQYGLGEYAKQDISAADAQPIISAAAQKYGDGSIEVKALQSALDALADSTQDVTDSQEKLTQANKDAKQKQDSKDNSQKGWQKKVAAFQEEYQKYAQNAESLPGLAKALNIDQDSGFAKSMQGIADTANSAGQALGDYASGNYVGAAVNALNAIGSLSQVVGIGGDSDASLASDIEKLTAQNEALQYAVEELTDAMEDASFTESVDIYKEQLEDMQNAADNTQEMMSRSGAAYKSGWGGTHSSNSKINDSMSSSEWSRISKIVDKTVDSAGDFFSLTSSEMKQVAVQAPDLYAKIKQLADDGYANAAEYMDEYIEYGEKIDELTDAFNEKMTGISLDSAKSEMESLLQDMDSSFSDAADNIESYLRNAIVSAILSSEKYTEWFSGWFEDFSTKMQDGTLTKEEAEASKQEYLSYYASARDAVNAALEAAGLDSVASGQSASYGESSSITQEQASELLGRATAVEFEEGQGNVLMTLANAKLDTVIVNTAAISTIADNMRDMIAKSYLELQMINENTAAVIRPIQNISDKMDSVEKKIKNL